jgi:cytosine/adenosine deaminase-related metal-dependent hydrolase
MILIQGGRVASAGTWNGEFRDILIEGDRIADVTAPGNVTREAETIDASRMLIIPGLVNAHTHAHGNLAKGVADRWPLEVFLNWGPWSLGRTVEHYRVAALIGAAEMVRKGCTAAYDLFAEYPTPSVVGIEAVARSYQEIGVRAAIAPMMADRSLYEAMPGFIDVLPTDVKREIAEIRYAPAQTTVEACRVIAQSWAIPTDQVKFALGPTIPHHCSDDFLRALRDLACEFGLDIHMHVAESKPDVLAGIDRYGKTAVAHLQDLGILGPRFIAAHCVWLDDNDMARFADHGVMVAHNPGANMKLGSGLADVRAMIQRGITVGVGADGSRSSDNQNMFEAMRLAAFTSRVVGRMESEWLSAEDAFAATTLGGAKLLGWEGEIGEIRKGAKADLVLLRTADFNYMPLNNPIAQLVFCEDGTSVHTVMIGGRFVLRDGKFTRLDVNALSKRAEIVTEDMRRINAEARKRAETFEPHVASYAQALAGRDYHVNRFSGRP